jgi:glycosyltransferase involved in cell wall biosynthesis
MNACDFGCLSSSFGEAFPNVLAEFLSCGRPCVATDVGDSALIVDRFGRIVPPRDPARLADALVALAGMSEAERAALGAGGRTSVAERFAIRKVAERHAALWREAAQ